MDKKSTILTRSLVEESAKAVKVQHDNDGDFWVVYWEDETFGVIRSKDVVEDGAKNNSGFNTGKARYNRESTYSVVYLFRGSDEEKLFCLAECINNKVRQIEQKQPKATKRQPKKKSFAEFEVDEAEDVPPGGKVVEVAGGKVVKRQKVSQSGEKTGKGPVVSRKGPVASKKEVLLAEKKKKEESRKETLKHATDYVLQHVSIGSSSKNTSPPPSPNPLPPPSLNPLPPPASNPLPPPSPNPSPPPSPESSPSPSLLNNQGSPYSPYHSTAPSSFSNSSLPEHAAPSFQNPSNASHQLTTSASCNNFQYFSHYQPPQSYMPFQSQPYFQRHMYANPNMVASDASNSYSVPQTCSSSNSTLVGTSLSLATGEGSECGHCVIKDQKIQSLEFANDQANRDIFQLQQRVRELEAQVAQREERPICGSKETPVDHYIPSRGIVVELADYKLIPANETVEENFERLAEGEELCVPRSWLCCVLAKCKGKGNSFTFKKLIDGFFEPEDLARRKAVELCRENKIMKAIKLYSLSKLKMKESDFHSHLNSKLNSCRRVVKTHSKSD